eukprot:TRINITY_DN4049_c0_g4_i1.p1 TRINITY_DN4049_c0_g4~~TRINITY_DN4049_c0_g4_i1.p1  ORF type:complete len:305 (+),score=81.31 TRINITY_DN4049_c0_g4_i1:205-1119(+)
MNSSVSDKWWIPYLCGSCASMFAETATLPIDITKIRLQLQGETSTNGNGKRYKGMIHCGVSIVKNEGLISLYKGIKPALLRQCVYSGIRIGTYQSIKSYLAGETNANNLSLWKKILAGASTGAFAASVATPTDLIKVRLQGQGKLLPGENPRYNGLFHAFSSIIKNEGFFGLWRGVVPTVQRAAIINAAELATYDHFKEFLLRRKIVSEDKFATHLVASLMAGFMGTLFSNPIDVMKTRIMNQRIVNGIPTYLGMTDCLRKTIKQEGIFALYKGFIPNYARLGPWCVVFFVSFEQLKSKITPQT